MRFTITCNMEENNMLSKPYAGWTEFTLEDFKVHGSDLTDIPLEWMRAAVHGMKYYTPAAFYLDEEGAETTIAVNEYRTYIIRQHNGETLKTIHMGLFRFTEMLVADIRENLDSWVYWSLECCRNATFEERKAELQALIDEAEALLNPKK